MSKILSLKLRDDIFRDAERVRTRAGKARNAYINEAVHLYNTLWRRRGLKSKLHAESALVAAESREVLEEFERLEDSLT